MVGGNSKQRATTGRDSVRGGVRRAGSEASQDKSSSGELVRTCKSSPERATSVPSWTSHTPSPHRLHSLGSAGRRSRRQWGSACAMRLARSAPSCKQGTPGHSKIAQRRRGGWPRPGRRDPGRRGAWATWRMCHNDDNSALRGPSRLWHGSETRLGPCTHELRPRKAVILAGAQRRFII